MWPTLPTLAMFPALVWFYARLARREEAQVREEFDDEWRRWAAVTPAFIPRLGALRNKKDKVHP